MRKILLTSFMAFTVFNTLFCQTWQPSGSNLFLNPTSSNLGIGTSSPSYRLHVDNGTLKIGNGTDATSRAVNMLSIGDGNYIQIGEWEADDKLSFKASGYNFTNGYIGVGTISPGARVHIEAPNGSLGLFINQQATSDYTLGMKINVNRDLTKAFVISNSSKSKDVFLVDGLGGVVANTFSTSSGGAFYANSIGQYGFGFHVGVTNDLAKAFSLTDKNNKDVFYVWGNGVINTKKIYAEAFEVRPDAMSINWFDHVFSTSYKLKSLNEVEKYVKENSHLPEIPSEREVKENGFNLAEMDGLLLKKIEELTLYVIQQQKEIEQLKQNQTTTK